MYIIANDRAAFTVANNPWPDRVQFIELPFANPITIWTQDPFLVLGEPGPDGRPDAGSASLHSN